MSQETVTIYLNAQSQTAGVQAFVGALNGIKAAADGIGLRLGSVQSMVQNAFAPLVSILSAGTLVKGFKDATDSADEMGKAAAKAGADSVETFSQLAYSASQADVTIQGLTAGAKGLSQWMERTGQSGRDFIPVLLEQADLFAALPDNLDKVRLAQDRFGKSGQELIPLLNQGSEAIKRQMEQAQTFGLTVGPAFAKNAQEFNDNIKSMGGFIKGEFMQAADEALPHLIEFQKKLLKFEEDHASTLKKITRGTVDFIAQHASFFAGMLNPAFGSALALIQAQQVTAEPGGTGAAGGQKLPGVGSPLGETAAQIAVANQRREIEAVELKLAEARLDVTKTEHERNVEVIRYLEERLAMQRVLVDLIGEQVSKEQSVDPEGRISKEKLENLRQQGQALKENLQTVKELSERNATPFQNASITLIDHVEIDKNTTFLEQFTLGLEKLYADTANISAQIGKTISSGIGNAISSVSTGIWDVIDGTRTWGSIFLQAGRNIISNLLQIALTQVIVRGAMMATAAVARALGHEEIAMSIEKFTINALAGATNESTHSGAYGLLLYLGVLAATIGAVYAMSAGFATGGVVPGGEQLIRINEQGTESVLNARATRNLGSRMIDMLNAGAIGAQDIQNGVASNFAVPMEPAFSPASDSGRSGQGQQVLIVVDNREEAMNAALEFPSAQTKIVELVRGRRMDIGIPT
jgi:hypothetical protein